MYYIICVCAHVCVCICVYVCIAVGVHVCIYTYLYTYIHEYIHTYIQIRACFLHVAACNYVALTLHHLCKLRDPNNFLSVE